MPADSPRKYSAVAVLNSPLFLTWGVGVGLITVLFYVFTEQQQSGSSLSQPLRPVRCGANGPG